MTSDRKRRERTFEALLTAYDDAALSGRGEEFEADLPAELAERLREARQCVDQLHAVWGAAFQAGGYSAATAGASPGEPNGIAGASIGRFQIERKLGQGGAGIVFLAIDPKLRRRVALKVPRPEGLISSESRQRFLLEGEVAARLNHPHIVAVHEVGEIGPICYIAAEYCEGVSLAAWLNARAGATPPRQAAQIIATLAAALHHAHVRGVLHRDMKPSNVMLSPVQSEPGAAGDAWADLDAYTAKVSDFGLAKLLESNGDETRTGTVLGTPRYMAPEQAEGRIRDIGVHTDVHALGSILYELLTGGPPFCGATDTDTLRRLLLDDPAPPRRRRADVPCDLEAICLKCLEKSPEHRYATAAALEADLRRYLAGEPTHARPLGTVRRLGKWARRRPAVAGLAAVLAVALVTIFIGSIVYRVRLEHSLAETSHQREVAENSDQRSRQLLYTADMGRAHEAWKNGHAGELLEILRQHRPRGGQPDLREFSWHYLRGLCDQQVLTMRGHEGAVFSVDASNHGRFWATGGIDHTVRLWNAASGQNCGVWRGHANEVTSVAFAPDGNTLASGSEDHTVRLWSVPDGTLLGVLAGHTDHVLCLAFSDDGKWLASGSRDGTVRVWNPANRQSIVSLAAGRNPLESVDFSSRARLLVAGDGTDGTVFSWKTDGWQPLPSAQDHGSDTENMLALAHAPQRDWMAGGGRKNEVYLWETADNGLQLIHELKEGHFERIQSVAFSPGDPTLASADNRGHIQLWDLESFARKGTILGHPSRVWSVAWSPDGRRLASAGADGTVRVWNPQARQDGAFAYPPLPRVSRYITFSPDGRYLLASCKKNGVHWFDTRSQISTRQDRSYPGDERRLCVSPDGRFVAARGKDGTTILRAAGESTDRLAIPGGRHHFGPLCFSPDGKRLATTSDLGTAVIVDCNSGQVVHRFAGSPVDDLAFSPDGRRFARAGERLLIYDTQGMNVVLDLDHAGSVCYSADSRILLTRLRSEVRAYEARTGRLLHKVVLDEIDAALALHPDGKTLAVCLGQPARIMLWDVRTGQELLSIDPPGPVVSNLLFSPTGDRLVATGEDTTGQDHIWEWAIRRDLD
jgi:WD40 repeat protein/serine/threonine protein kinase